MLQAAIINQWNGSLDNDTSILGSLLGIWKPSDSWILRIVLKTIAKMCKTKAQRIYDKILLYAIIKRKKVGQLYGSENPTKTGRKQKTS